MKEVICNQAQILSDEECSLVSGGGWFGNLMGAGSSGSTASNINKGQQMSNEANRNNKNSWSGGCNTRAGGNNGGGSSRGSGSGRGSSGNGRGGNSGKN